jgi:hypothetical protein
MELRPGEVESEEFTSYQTLQTALLEVSDVDRMLIYALYSDLISKADRCLGSLAERLDMSPDQTFQFSHNWIETADETLRFPLFGDRSPDII